MARRTNGKARVETRQQIGAPGPGGEERSDEAPGADARSGGAVPDPEVLAKPSRSRPLCGHGVTVNRADGSWTTYCQPGCAPQDERVDQCRCGRRPGRVQWRSTGPHAHVVLHRGRKEDDHVEYVDHTSDRPADSRLNPGGC